MIRGLLNISSMVCFIRGLINHDITMIKPLKNGCMWLVRLSASRMRCPSTYPGGLTFSDRRFRAKRPKDQKTQSKSPQNSYLHHSSSGFSPENILVIISWNTNLQMLQQLPSSKPKFILVQWSSSTLASQFHPTAAQR